MVGCQVGVEGVEVMMEQTAKRTAPPFGMQMTAEIPPRSPEGHLSGAPDKERCTIVFVRGGDDIGTPSSQGWTLAAPATKPPVGPLRSVLVIVEGIPTSVAP